MLTPAFETCLRKDMVWCIVPSSCPGCESMFKSFGLKRKKIAVALEYKASDADDAPRIVAKGFDHQAEAIANLANKNNVPVHNDPDLAQLLASLEIGEYIPPAAFMAVANVLRHIYQQKPNSTPEKFKSS